MAGVASSPVATGPYGIGTAVPATVTTTKVLKGDQGKQFGSRKLTTGDPTIGQYAFDSDGNVVGDKDVRQLVILAITTEFGSSVIPTLGRGPTPRKITADFAPQMTARIERALSDLVRDQFITIDSIAITETDGGRTSTLVRITDLTTKQQFGLSI